MNLHDFAFLVLYPVLVSVLALALLLSVFRSSKPIRLRVAGLGIRLDITREPSKGLMPHTEEFRDDD
jgi:hypothetical protein